MRIGVLSDTHIDNATTLPYRVTMMPLQVEEIFSGVDLILHAGDIFDRSVLDRLQAIAPVLAAKGDHDHFDTPDERVKDRHILEIEGLTIWLSHDFPLKWWGWVYDSAFDEKLVEALKPYGATAPSVIVFGHSHRAIVRSAPNLLLVNPGSPTLPKHERQLGTVGVITITSGVAMAELVQLKEQTQLESEGPTL